MERSVHLAQGSEHFKGVKLVADDDDDVNSILVLSHALPVPNGLNQTRVLSPLLSGFTLEMRNTSVLERKVG
jgi:hypothetical protein